MIVIKSLYAPVVGRLPLAGEKASGDSALFVAVIRHAFTAFAVSRAGIGAGAGACVVAVGHSLLLARGSAFFDYAAFCRRCQRPPFSTWCGRTLFSCPAASPCKHDGGSAVIFFGFCLGVLTLILACGSQAVRSPALVRSMHHNAERCRLSFHMPRILWASPRWRHAGPE